MPFNPDLAPRGVSRFITVVRATLQGVFQVSLVMEKANPLPPPTSLYHWIWIVPCGYAPTAHGALLSPIMLEWQEQVAGRSLAVEVIDNFSYLRNICSFSSNSFDRLRSGQKRGESKARRLLAGRRLSCWSGFFCLVCWQQLQYICICLPLSEPASKTDSLENEGW